MSGVILNGASFRNAQLQRSVWIGALLSNVDFSEASLAQTDMRNSQWVDVTLDETIFSEADLRNASLIQLNATNIDFSWDIPIDGSGELTMLGSFGTQTPDVAPSSIMPDNQQTARVAEAGAYYASVGAQDKAGNIAWRAVGSLRCVFN